MQEENEHLVILSRRLKKLMEERGLKPKELAERSGFTPTAISYWVNGERMAGAVQVDKLAEVFGVPMEYFLGSEGRLERPAKAISIVEKQSGPYWGQSGGLAPIVSRVQAGDAHAWEDAGPDAAHIKVNCPDQNTYCVAVWGDSMETVYHEGDILVIAPNIEPTINDLVVFKTTENEPYFKKWLGAKKGVHRFASFNPNYEVKEFAAEELGPMHPVHSVIRPLKGEIF